MANKTQIPRRSSKDPKWQTTKECVDKRDKRQCRFMKCLSAAEAHQLRAGTEKTLDRAHIFAASSNPELIYNPNNVMTLHRFIHRRMDEWKDPISGDSIDVNYHFYWWYRIKNSSIEKYDPEIDYELKLREQIIR